MMQLNNPLQVWKKQSLPVRLILRYLSRVDRVEDIYERWIRDEKNAHGEPGPFLDFSLRMLGANVRLHNEQLLERIPKEGPLIVVANHPLGCIEGMLLTQLLLKYRPDTRVLANQLLKIFPEFEDIFIGVDVLNPGKQFENGKSIREVIKTLRNNGVVLIFPAGTVSEMKLPGMHIADPDWYSTVGRLAVRCDTPVLPLYIDARNPTLFYLSSYIHKRLRTLLLPRVMLKKRTKPIDIHVGRIVPAYDLTSFDTPETATGFLRLTCELLKKDPSPPASPEVRNSSDLTTKALVPQSDSLKAHVEDNREACLIQREDFSVLCLPYDRMGPLMPALALEREQTFRAVKEGSGKVFDTDRFDLHYDHLILWDEKAGRIAGGYRLGRVDCVVEKAGLSGLYSHSLFEYDHRFINSIGKGIEAGRSFVSIEYQRNPKALDLLWKGIGRYTLQKPGYHTLFGCVSVSPQYNMLARALLRDSLLTYYGSDADLQSIVKARHPMNLNSRPWSDEDLHQLGTLPVLNKLLGCVDVRTKVPVLIRHYLALNGKFVSFTVNKGFNSSLDGLIVLDLRESPSRYLKRFFDLSGPEAFEPTNSKTAHVA
ncbi:MAG: GNAT family N-acyltransferase [Verrucomicrobiota bacterium]